ncbi:MAG: 50S ribosomal protein L13 [Oscillospiraceae bacterium]|nr:50S ribosomal protein L13 [Oscillospiraceae bacterium]
MGGFVPKVKDLKRSWYIIDAKGLPLGRLASQVASILRGKVRTIFFPSLDIGDFVVVINCAKVLLTGRKIESKCRYSYTGYVGNLKKISYPDLMNRKPELAVKLAVRGMLPSTSLGRRQFGRLFAFCDEKHNHEAQKPEEWVYFRKVRNMY